MEDLASLNLESRYMPVTESGCWIWLGHANAAGYGIVGLGRKGKKAGAHRFFWEAANGPINDGLFVCHKCDTPICVNPDHLFLGTHADNMRDRKQKGRYLGGWNGRAKLSESDVKQIRDLSCAMSYTDVARAYGVNLSTVCDILRGRTWRHI